MVPIADSLPPNLEQLRQEMGKFGVENLEVCTWQQRHMLRGRIKVRWGKYAGSTQQIGWSFPDDSQPFPEYAPHWFHIAGEFNDGKQGSCERDVDETGATWVAWSRPVGPNWVEPHKTCKNLFRFTVARFWKAAL